MKYCNNKAINLKFEKHRYDSGRLLDLSMIVILAMPGCEAVALQGNPVSGQGDPCGRGHGQCGCNYGPSSSKGNGQEGDLVDPDETFFTRSETGGW